MSSLHRSNGSGPPQSQPHQIDERKPMQLLQMQLGTHIRKAWDSQSQLPMAFTELTVLTQRAGRRARAWKPACARNSNSLCRAKATMGRARRAGMRGFRFPRNLSAGSTFSSPISRSWTAKSDSSADRRRYLHGTGEGDCRPFPHEPGRVSSSVFCTILCPGYKSTKENYLSYIHTSFSNNINVFSLCIAF